MCENKTGKKTGIRQGKAMAGKIAGVLLGTALLAGCGTMPPADGGQASRRGNAGDATYISVEDAKAAVLENAGLSPDQVRFVRFGLDTGADSARYEIEFVSEDAGYDYGIDAVTGEILSMSCEAGSYNLADVSMGAASGETNPEGTQPPGGTGQEDTGSMEGSMADGGLPGEEGQYIGRNRAQQIALEHAALEERDVKFVHARLEFDDGIWIYDVEFHRDQTEYDYEIHAITGEILEFDQDAEYYQGASGGNGEQMLTQEDAVRLALEHAGVDRQDVQSLEVELDYDDGRSEYEVEWDVGRMEYSCDVDAYSGQILSFEKELD